MLPEPMPDLAARHVLGGIAPDVLQVARVLRARPYGAERVYPVVGAQPDAAAHHRMVVDAGALPDLDVTLDDASVPDIDAALCPDLPAQHAPPCDLWLSAAPAPVAFLYLGLGELVPFFAHARPAGRRCLMPLPPAACALPKAASLPCGRWGPRRLRSRSHLRRGEAGGAIGFADREVAFLHSPRRAATDVTCRRTARQPASPAAAGRRPCGLHPSEIEGVPSYPSSRHPARPPPRTGHSLTCLLPEKTHSRSSASSAARTGPLSLCRSAQTNPLAYSGRHVDAARNMARMAGMARYAFAAGSRRRLGRRRVLAEVPVASRPSSDLAHGTASLRPSLKATHGRYPCDLPRSRDPLSLNPRTAYPAAPSLL